ncbi:hypothetical protein [Conyzicola sp.]|uniref:hypothetical protein n=1 Tax=Conyzicola sp. TaxID=1969404 RepID=UPI003989DD2A
MIDEERHHHALDHDGQESEMAERRIPKPRTTQGDAGNAPHDETKVAAFGDSLMWGQGLPRDKRFSVLFVDRLPILTKRRPASLVWDASRSGAQIKARENRIFGRFFESVLYSDRAKFLDRFPKYFANADQRKAFIAGEDDGPARKLYGEVPAPFPSVIGQVKLLSKAGGKGIDVALVDGGVNDLDVEDIVNPQVETGAFVERWEGDIKQVAYHDVLQLLKAIRGKCPNAVIMYFGFFPTVSETSDTGRIRELFKHEYNNDVAWWFNEHIWEAVDVDELIFEATIRGEWFHNRFLFWARRAIAEANRDEDLRGPGILFVPSQFGRDQAVFAPSTFLWEDYTDATGDPARHDRIVGLPRSDALSEMVKLKRNAAPVYTPAGDSESPGKYSVGGRSLAKQLRAGINGPTKLRETLLWYSKVPDDISEESAIKNAARLKEQLVPEINRIQHALIASMGHPNLEGAKAYADSATNRYRLHLEAMKTLAKPRNDGAEVPFDTTLRKYNVRGTGPVEADVGMLNVDSLEIQAKTRTNSDAGLLPDIWLVIQTKSEAGAKRTKEYRLNFRYKHHRLLNVRSVSKLYAHFEPEKTNVLSVDTLGVLELDEIVGCALVVGPDPYDGDGTVHNYGTHWHPENIELRVNGRRVLRLDLDDHAYGPSDVVDLNYPAPIDRLAVPALSPTLPLKQVKKLVIKKDYPAAGAGN